MEEDAQCVLQVIDALGESNGLSGEALEAMPKGSIDAFDVRGFSGFLSHGRVVWKCLIVVVPEIAVSIEAGVRIRDCVSELLAAEPVARPEYPGDDLAGTPTQGDPEPLRILFRSHESSFAMAAKPTLLAAAFLARLNDVSVPTLQAFSRMFVSHPKFESYLAFLVHSKIKVFRP